MEVYNDIITDKQGVLSMNFTNFVKRQLTKNPNISANIIIEGFKKYGGIQRQRGLKEIKEIKAFRKENPSFEEFYKKNKISDKDTKYLLDQYRKMGGSVSTKQANRIRKTDKCNTRIELRKICQSKYGYLVDYQKTDGTIGSITIRSNSKLTTEEVIDEATAILWSDVEKYESSDLDSLVCIGYYECEKLL